MARFQRWIVAALSAGAAAPVLALSPSEVFDKASPSVWAVRGLDADERPFSYGSGVVVGPGQLVTNCSILARAKAIQLRRDNVLYEAKLEHADLERDLCLLSAKNFTAPAAQLARFEELKVGQRVFAIGNPQKLALTLSEGLISGLRGEEGETLLQTTAPLSPGSGGGGLFDERGALVGITTFGIANRQRTSQNLNFAVPAQWIPEIAERSKQAMARRNQPAADAPKQIAGLPAMGATWRYSYQDRKYRTPERLFSVRVAETRETEIRETFSPAGQQGDTVAINPSAVRFAARRLSGEHAVIELGPYFFSGDRAADATSVRPAGYPGAKPWETETLRVEPDDVSVPAGTFKAQRVEVRGKIVGADSMLPTIDNDHLVSRFHYTAWYSPEVRRYVMVRNVTWNLRGTQIGEEVVQLLEYSPK